METKEDYSWLIKPKKVELNKGLNTVNLLSSLTLEMEEILVVDIISLDFLLRLT